MTISKSKIKNTVACFWSAEEQTFLAESSLIPGVVLGVGETFEQAVANFSETLDDVYNEFSNDNVAGYKSGRPSKGYVAFNANIRPSSKLKLGELSEQLDISQGEVVDFLLFFYECKSLEIDVPHSKNEMIELLQTLRTEQQNGLKLVCERLAHFETSNRETVISLVGLKDIEKAVLTVANVPVRKPVANNVVALKSPAGDLAELDIRASLKDLNTITQNRVYK